MKTQTEEKLVATQTRDINVLVCYPLDTQELPPFSHILNVFKGMSGDLLRFNVIKVVGDKKELRKLFCFSSPYNIDLCIVFSEELLYTVVAKYTVLLPYSKPRYSDALCQLRLNCPAKGAMSNCDQYQRVTLLPVYIREKRLVKQGWIIRERALLCSENNFINADNQKAEAMVIESTDALIVINYDVINTETPYEKAQSLYLNTGAECLVGGAYFISHIYKVFGHVIQGT